MKNDDLTIFGYLNINLGTPYTQGNRVLNASLAILDVGKTTGAMGNHVARSVGLKMLNKITDVSQAIEYRKSNKNQR